MSNKDYLSRYKKIERELFCIEEEQRAIRNRLYSLQACSYDDVPKSPNKSIQAKFERLVEKVLAIDEMVTNKIDELVDTQSDIKMAIGKVEDSTLRTLLTYRYLCGKTWEQIAVDMGYSYMHVCRLHGKALGLVKRSK